MNTRLASQHHAERLTRRIMPGGFVHRSALGPQPDDIRRALLRHIVTVQETGTAQNGMLSTQPNQLAGEIKQCPVAGIDSSPIDPGQLVVLTVHIVVASLTVADLVAGKQHRCALA